jgi:hypothetical protein
MGMTLHFLIDGSTLPDVKKQRAGSDDRLQNLARQTRVVETTRRLEKNTKTRQL